MKITKAENDALDVKLARQTRRQTRRQVLRAGVTASAAGGVLAACAMPGSETAPQLSAKEVTITYVSDWSASPRVDWIKAAIPRFTEENPKIKVQVDNWAGEVGVVAIANAAAGTQASLSGT